ncbi:major capsid protein [Chelatococcus sp. XZ-Ab1]|uniref:major capsid protein n=1 Tax=Chelatococcus sp. XZ-Ab1 TaxID=3034027 RepID=UPI0023E3DCB9|nr:hypothetical protein [Chelatococcus sp. XZ-Ab1]
MAEEFDEALTLVQYSQRLDEGSAERAVVETFVGESDVMAAMVIRPANKGKYRYPQEEELPDVKFRGYNEPGNVSQGRTSMQEEGVFLMDEYVKVDRALVDELGPQHRAEQESMKVKAMSRHFTQVFLNGDNISDPREPKGIKLRSAMSEQTVIHNATGSGGGALSLAKLDEAINEVRNPTHIICDRAFKPLLNAAARSPTLTNNMLNLDMKDPFGRKVLAFGELPFLFGYPKSRGDSILPFNEVAFGGGAAQTTSMFVVSMGEDGVFMIEGVPVSVRDEGQLPGVPLLSTHIKWDWGMVSKEYSICRLDSITQAPIVA